MTIHEFFGFKILFARMVGTSASVSQRLPKGLPQPAFQRQWGISLHRRAGAGAHRTHRAETTPE